MIAIAFQIKDAMFICTLGFTWKEESPTAPSGVLDPGGVEEEVTSGKTQINLCVETSYHISRKATWSRIRDSDDGSVTLLLQRVLRLRRSLGADHHSRPVPVGVNCIRLLVGGVPSVSKTYRK